MVLAVVAGWAGSGRRGAANAATRSALESEQHARKSATAALESEKEAKTAQKTTTQVQQIARHTSDPTSSPQRSLLLAVYAATLQPHDTVGLLGAIDGVRQQLRAAAGLPLDGRAAEVVAAAYSPDRRWLATGAPRWAGPPVRSDGGRPAYRGARSCRTPRVGCRTRVRGGRPSSRQRRERRHLARVAGRHGVAESPAA